MRSASRAVRGGIGHACAIGSNADLGLWHTFFATALRKMGENFYELGPRP